MNGLKNFIFDIQRFADITNSKSNILVSGTSGNDSIYNYGNDNVTISGGDGNDSISNYSSNASIDGGAGNDSIDNHSSNTSVDGGDGDDTIYSYISNNVIIDGGNGNDEIYNSSYADSVTINGGAGNDYIYNGSSNVTIDGGADNDTIQSYSSNVSINAGDGDDSVYCGVTLEENGSSRIPDNATIEGGKGNDYISTEGANNLYKYSEGDGFDTIANYFNGTLQIGGGTGIYSTQQSGSDMPVTVGEGKITLAGAADLSKVNIQGTYVNPLLIVGTQGADNIRNTLSGATIQALGGDDYIYNNKISNVSINAGDGSDTITNHSGGTIGLSTLVAVNGGNGNDSIENWGGDNVSLAGEEGDDTLANYSGNKVLLSGGSGNDSLRNHVGDDVTILAGAGNDYIRSYIGNNISIEGSAGNDTISLGDSLTNILIQYTSGDDNDLIQGFNETSTLQIGGGSGTYSTQVSGNDIIVTVGDGSITLKDAANLSAVNIKGEEIFTEPVWTLDDTTATYGTANETLITVTGVKSLDGISLSGTTVTIAKASVNAKNITISDGYTLKLASDVNKPGTTKAWTLDGTTATYNQTTTAGYTLTNNEIIYSKKSTTPLATVEGVTNSDGLSIDEENKIVTVSTNSLGTSKVTISNGYNLAPADDVETSSTIPADWSLEGTTATYFSESTNEGYTLADNAITYSEGTTAAALVTVKGVKASTGLSLNGTVVTVAKASLTNKNITVSDGYTLKLAKNVAAPSTLEADWTLDGTTATYFSESKTKGYTPASDSKSIKYSKAVAEKSLAQIDGVTSTDGLTISSNTIKATASGLAKNISVSSDSYVFDFASDYKKVTISGGEDDETIKAAGQRVILSGGAGDDSIFGSGKYTSINAGIGDNFVELGAKASNSTVRSDGGNDTVSNKSSNALIDTKGGKDVIVNEGASTTIDSGAGNDSIANSGADVSISAGNVIFKIGSGQITVQDAADKLIAYEDANGVKRLYPVEFNSTYTGATLRSEYGKDEFISSNYTDYGTLKTVDASAVEHDMTIEGNKEANYITGSTQDDFINGYSGADVLYGGAGADTLAGSGGNDKLFGEAGNDSLSGGSGEDTLEGGKGRDSLTGGSGADVFSFNVGDGANVITDYNEAQGDKISINAAASSVKYEVGKSNVLFTFGTSDRVTLKNSAEQAVTWIDEDGVEHVINDPKTVIYNNAGTGATLTSFYEDDAFTPDNYSDYATTLKTIDSSAVTHTPAIEGNKLANYITGSDQNDTIDGASGADTIYGGGGNDKLFGEAGNDYLSGGDGHNILWGGADNDTLVGGEGYNTFIYNDGDGKDVIEGYRDGYDIIILNSGKIEALYEDGNDVVFEIGTGSITVKDAKSQVVALYDSSGNMYRPYHRANAN